MLIYKETCVNIVVMETYAHMFPYTVTNPQTFY